jgi:hypothetical protein
MTTKILQALLIGALLSTSAAFADSAIEVSVVAGKQQAKFSIGDAKCAGRRTGQVHADGAGLQLSTGAGNRFRSISSPLEPAGLAGFFSPMQQGGGLPLRERDQPISTSRPEQQIEAGVV